MRNKRQGRVVFGKPLQTRNLTEDIMLGKSCTVSGDDLRAFMTPEREASLQDFLQEEPILLDVTEALGTFWFTVADVGELLTVQKSSMDTYAMSKSHCIELYRDIQRRCQETDMRKLERMHQSGIRGAPEQMLFNQLCNFLGALHQTIYDKPMKLYRAEELFQLAGESNTGRRPRGGNKTTHIRPPKDEGEKSPVVIEEPLCILRRDGSLNCTLARDIGGAGTVLLDMKALLRVTSRVEVRLQELNEALRQYEQKLEQNLEGNKTEMQAQYRTIYQACMEFLKLRGKSISSLKWTQFNHDCVRLVALRKVLYNKEVPYNEKKKLASKGPERGFDVSDMKDALGQVSTSRQNSSTSNKDVGSSTRSGASGSRDFVRTKKAEELYGKVCLLGDENTQGAHILFKDIVQEPDITLHVDDAVGEEWPMFINGDVLMKLYIEALHRCRNDRQGAEMICQHLSEVFSRNNPAQISNLVQIGCKKAQEDYNQLAMECVQNLMLRCILKGEAIKICIGGRALFTSEEAEVQ